MGGKFLSAVKCFFKCPACTMSVMLNPEAFLDPGLVDSLKERCPDVDIESLGFYAGFFLALLFVIFCAIAYIFFNVLRFVLVHREMMLTLTP